MRPELYIGMISGTSIDALDCALVDFSEPTPKLVDFINTDIPADLKTDLLNLCSPGKNQIQLMGQIDIKLAELFALSAKKIMSKHQLQPDEIKAIGCHGQTIWHQPPDNQNSDNTPYTIQIGDPSTIAAQTGITTVADFRSKDITLGGQGAPLVPAFHREVFSSKGIDRIILNTGGIANITLLPKSRDHIVGFDTGPANVLMDNWIRKHKQLEFDEDGQWAASAQFNPQLLAHFLDDPYFALPHPKSTGRELFNDDWLEQKLVSFGSDVDDAVVQASLLELSAVSISIAIKELLGSGEVIVCGGGARNSQLMHRLQHNLDNFKVIASDQLGLGCDSVEACAFAWLAKMTMEKSPVDFTEITGSSRPAISGGIYYP